MIHSARLIRWTIIALGWFVFPVLCLAQSARIDSLRTYLNPSIQEPETVASILELTEDLMRNGKPAEAREWLRLAYDISTTIEYNEGSFDVQHLLGNLFLNSELADSASVAFQHAVRYAETPEQRLKLHNSQGNTHNMNNQPILAIEFYERAIALADSLNDERYTVGLKLNLGNVYSSLGNEIGALRAYYDGLEFAEQGTDSSFIATSNNNVGRQLHDLENYDQAEYFLLRSEEISRASNHYVNLRRALLNLGNLYSSTEQFDLAQSYYEEVLEMARQAGDQIAETRILYNIGLLEFRKGNYADARELFTISLERSTSLNIIEGEFHSATGMGNLELETGNIPQALRWYGRANQKVDNDRFNNLRLDSYHNLYRAYKRAGNQALALQWLESYNELNDELTDSEKSRFLAEYEVRFDIASREQQSQLLRARELETQARLELQNWFIFFTSIGIAFSLLAAFYLFKTNQKSRQANSALTNNNMQLNRMNLTIQAQNSELEQINQIKNKLFAIIAHDLRGPLSSLQSLLYLIREHDLSEDEMDQISKGLERNLQENASMMDNLLAWAHSQMNGIKINYRKFQLSQCINSVADQMRFQAEKKKIGFHVDVPDDIYIDADYDIIKLVVRNLSANAIKFSRENDTITVSASRKGDLVEVRIKDEGVGIKERGPIQAFLGRTLYKTRNR